MCQHHNYDMWYANAVPPGEYVNSFGFSMSPNFLLQVKKLCGGKLVVNQQPCYHAAWKAEVFIHIQSIWEGPRCKKNILCKVPPVKEKGNILHAIHLPWSKELSLAHFALICKFSSNKQSCSKYNNSDVIQILCKVSLTAKVAQIFPLRFLNM